jgi:hypothetical protein
MRKFKRKYMSKKFVAPPAPVEVALPYAAELTPSEIKLFDACTGNPNVDPGVMPSNHESFRNFLRSMDSSAAHVILEKGVGIDPLFRLLCVVNLIWVETDSADIDIYSAVLDMEKKIFAGLMSSDKGVTQAVRAEYNALILSLELAHKPGEVNWTDLILHSKEFLEEHADAFLAHSAENVRIIRKYPDADRIYPVTSAICREMKDKVDTDGLALVMVFLRRYLARVIPAVHIDQQSFSSPEYNNV